MYRDFERDTLHHNQRKCFHYCQSFCFVHIIKNYNLKHQLLSKIRHENMSWVWENGWFLQLKFIKLKKRHIWLKTFYVKINRRKSQNHKHQEESYQVFDELEIKCDPNPEFSKVWFFTGAAAEMVPRVKIATHLPASILLIFIISGVIFWNCLTHFIIIQPRFDFIFSYIDLKNKKWPKLYKNLIFIQVLPQCSFWQFEFENLSL